MSQAVNPVSLLFPGPLARQGLAIASRLQVAFPPSLFQFKYLPSNVAKAWPEITAGNQPFLGLGFVGVNANNEANVFSGAAIWNLFVSIRRQGDPKSRFYGDAQGPGVMMLATAAAAVLHGQVAATGTITVGKIGSAVLQGDNGDPAVLQLELRVPLTLDLADLITRPDGLGLFEELSTTWNVPAASGSTDIYTSDWENPND